MQCKVTKIASIYNRSSLNLDFLKHLFSPNAFIALPLDLKTNRESATNVSDHYTFLYHRGDTRLFRNGRTLKNNCAHINFCLEKRDCKQDF